jgi:FAD/FMN-containing dehydrogenase
MPYTAVQRLFDPAVPFGLQYYQKYDHLSGLDDDVIELIVRHAAAVTSPLSAVLIFPLGGAVSRVQENDTAFGVRDAPYGFIFLSAWTDPRESERHIQWTRKFWTAMRPFARGAYVNELGDEGEDRVREAYTPATYERLVALKNKCDPTNLLRLNQNIKPRV